MRFKSNEAKLLAVIIAVAGLILIAYSLLATQNANNSYSSMMGMGSSTTTSSYYGLTNMVLAIVGAFMLASGALYAITRTDYEPMTYAPVTLVPVAQHADTMKQTVAPATIPSNHGEVASDPPISEPSALNEQNYLILRLLTGDERTMFRALVDLGGEASQKDLITTTKMSEAKVSRVIDRLVEKGVLVKERNGMGNKISIHVDS